jgi:hypothetical protein
MQRRKTVREASRARDAIALAIRATAGDNLEATIAGSIDEAFAGVARESRS